MLANSQITSTTLRVVTYVAATIALASYAQSQTVPSGGLDVPARNLPVPTTVSPQIQKLIGAPLRTNWNVLPWLEAQETALIKAFDANNWIYQTWAYDRHDVGTTPGMNGDYVKALRAIKAKTLIMVGTKDLLNPEWEPMDAARFIRDVRVVTISPGTVTGHASAGGGFPADVDFINREATNFLDLVTDRGKKLD